MCKRRVTCDREVCTPKRKICSSSVEQQTHLSQGEQPSSPLRKHRPDGPRLRIDESPVVNAVVHMDQSCHLQHLRLYSVVVSTLVFETDILSISEYREPGFEPQYDLSFCSVDGNGVMLFGYQPWHVGRGERQMCPVGDGLLRSIGCVRTWITSVKLTALPNRCSGRHVGSQPRLLSEQCSFFPS